MNAEECTVSIDMDVTVCDDISCTFKVPGDRHGIVCTLMFDEKNGVMYKIHDIGGEDSVVSIEGVFQCILRKANKAFESSVESENELIAQAMMKFVEYTEGFIMEATDSNSEKMYFQGQVTIPTLYARNADMKKIHDFLKNKNNQGNDK